MEKSKLIAILKKLLGGKDNLDFLLKLDEVDLKKLVALVRENSAPKAAYVEMSRSIING
jgi:hypothetical protein